MRLRALPAAWAAASALAGGCALRDVPYRFGAPMLGVADLPAPAIAPTPVEPRPLANRADPMPREDRIRVASAPAIREASAAAAAAVATAPAARDAERAKLPAPHRETSDRPPAPRTPAELRALVGQRDRRDPIAAALAWARAVGTRLPVAGGLVPPDAASASDPAIAARSGGAAGAELAREPETAADLIAWADRAQRLAGSIYPPAPGDLLVFDRAASERPSDLVAIAIDHDARGVTEVLYLGGGVVRRGFVDAGRPAVRRDASGAVVNTYLRHGKRWPPAGTRYLAGELLGHVIRLR